MGINSLERSFLDKYGLPYSLREDFVNSMLRLSTEKVDIFLGNHMQHNDTDKKAKLLADGNEKAFVNSAEWKEYNLWCIKNLENMLEREKGAKV